MKLKELFHARAKPSQGGKSLPKGRATKVSSDSAIKEMGSAEAGTGTEAPEVDELGLVPPPSNLPAPWAKRSVQPDEVSAPAESREPPKPHERAADRKQQDSQPYRKPVTEPQAVRPDQQLSANLDTTMDYILDGAMPVNAAAQHPSVAHQGHMQMDTSSIQNSDRSLIQVSNPSLPPHIRLDQFLQREPSAAYTISDSDTGTPNSNALWHLDSRMSSSTVIVKGGHNVKPSLTFTASIEDYAKKADPSTWDPPKFRKSQIVRIQPGIYPVPHKKLSESHSQYTKLNSYVKGTIHQIHKSTDSRDPREFVTDEGMVMYRVFALRRLTTNVEFIFVLEEQMTAFNECARCNAFASQQCSGCNKEWYCSEHCASADWRTHRLDCKHKGKTAPPFGAATSQEPSSEDTPGKAVVPTKAPLPGPRREFRTDGTVKIINGYKPDPNMFKGTTTVLPQCLRPLTLEEEDAPWPSSRLGGLLRSASHKLRRQIYKNTKHSLQIEEENGYIVKGSEHSGSEGQADGDAIQTAGGEPNLKDQDGSGAIVQMLADGTSQGAAISKQEDSLIGEALEEPSSLAERKDRSGLFGSNCHNSPNSEKSAESLVDGMAPNFASNQGLQAIMTQQSTASMPDLPRIRVRAQTPLQKAKSGISLANRIMKPPSKLSTAASGGPIAKSLPPLSGTVLPESLPEAFRRVAQATSSTAGSNTERSRESIATR